MTYIHALFVLLIALPALGRPLGLGLFEYDDDDSSSEESTDSETTGKPPTSSSACKLIDNVISYFGEVYEFLDKTFNPFHEEPATPPPPTTTLAPTTENITTAAPVQG